LAANRPRPIRRPEEAQDFRAIYPYDATLEDDTSDIYSPFSADLPRQRHSNSAKLFETIIEDEQAHMIYIETSQPSSKPGHTYLSKIAGNLRLHGPSTKGFLISGGN
jgi:bacterioferritin